MHGLCHAGTAMHISEVFSTHGGQWVTLVEYLAVGIRHSSHEEH